jgi:hypothetical protein
MASLYRKRPVVIEAIRFYGDNWAEICMWAKTDFGIKWLSPSCAEIIIETLEGNMTVSKGDWVIKGVNGEYYPCKPDIFEKTYEKV